MQPLLILLILAAHISCAYAQSSQTEAAIRQLEEREHQAVLKKDTTTLKEIWSKDFIVNAPSNKIVLSGASPLDRPVVTQFTYSSFTREIEEIQMKDNIVISMGNETLVPAHDTPKKGQTVKRRYTHIWMKEDGTWKLVARHANEICEL